MPQSMWALTFDRSRESWEGSTGLVRERVPVPRLGPGDRTEVIVRVHYAGFCGTDRGIWRRTAFGDLILGSLDTQGQDRRITGHELIGEVFEVGEEVGPRFGYRPGDVVTTESHLVCGTCYMCRLGETHVCDREQIIGITRDGCFAEYIKLPAHALWRTDLKAIRPEVAAIQEPFGNAVHACQVTDLAGKRVAVLGTGSIGLFTVLIARAMGASMVIGVEPDPHHADLARQLGCDALLTPSVPPAEEPWRADPALRAQVHALTEGVGVDVTLEMSGIPASLNNATHITRRGGHVVLFGVQDGDAVLQDFHRIVMSGLQLHGVVGRRIFSTWQVTRRLLERRDNGIQDAIWNAILARGDGTVVDIRDWDRADFEARMTRHPKMVLRFGPAAQGSQRDNASS